MVLPLHTEGVHEACGPFQAFSFSPGDFFLKEREPLREVHGACEMQYCISS